MLEDVERERTKWTLHVLQVPPCWEFQVQMSFEIQEENCLTPWPRKKNERKFILKNYDDH